MNILNKKEVKLMMNKKGQQISNLVGNVVLIAILGIVVTMLALVNGKIGDTMTENSSEYNISVATSESLEVAGDNQTLLMWIGYIAAIIGLLFGIFAFNKTRQ
jgi:hypothetical protein